MMAYEVLSLVRQGLFSMLMTGGIMNEIVSRDNQW